MMLKIIKITLLVLLLSIVSYSHVFSQTRVLDLRNSKLYTGLKFEGIKGSVLKERETQAAVDESEDGEPSGPSEDIEVLLADVFDEASPKHIREDFETKIPFSQKIIRDHTSLNTYYYFPAGYLLKRSPKDGYDINVLHRTRDDDSSEDLIILTFTLVPRNLYGGMSLVKKLAVYGIEPPANGKKIVLNRLPVSSAKISTAAISSFLPEENIKILNTPSEVGDPVRVQITMNQGQKENLVSSIRDGGISGEIVFDTNDDGYRLTIPYTISFKDYSGNWLTEITEMSANKKVENVSPFPVLFTGVVAYTEKSKQIERHEIPVAKPVLMEPGAIASSDKSFDQLVSSYGNMIAAWPMFESIDCDDCLNSIEQKILVSPSQAQRTELPIEVIPSLFDQFSVFKVLVEVKSKLFSPNNPYEDTKVITLRADESRSAITLYVNRDEDQEATNFEYRIRPVLNSGEPTTFSDWKGNQGVMDITITAADIRSQISDE